MTSVSRFERIDKLDNAVTGSIYGDLYLFRFPAMFIDKNAVVGFSTNGLLKTEMALSRGFSAHTSRVISTALFSSRYVFSTALQDQCILQWRVEFEDQDWELDYNKLNTEIKDPFAEVPTQERFKSLFSEIWNQRLEVARINQDVDIEEQSDPACEFELESVIGRRAFDRRSNLQIDCLDRILYDASSLIVFLLKNQDPDPESVNEQKFLRPEGNQRQERKTAVSPEISAFALSEDKRLLAIGTA